MKPTDPQELHTPRPVVERTRAGVSSVCVKYTDDSSVVIGMIEQGLAVVGQHKDVAVRRSRIDYILATPNIIRCIVNPQDTVLVNLVVLELDAFLHRGLDPIEITLTKKFRISEALHVVQMLYPR